MATDTLKHGVIVGALTHTLPTVLRIWLQICKDISHLCYLLLKVIPNDLLIKQMWFYKIVDEAILVD